MLQQYVTDTRDLLNDSDGQFFDEAKLIRYVNRSRRRIAYASGCVRVMPPGTKTHRMQEVYRFAEWISSVQGVMPGVQSILACRSLAVSVGVGGWKPMWRRISFSDFQARFRIMSGTWMGTISEPGWWAQFGQGNHGSIYLAPIPSQDNQLEVDLTCIPEPLQTDHDPEPIPQPWQDAVPWWAAVMCLIQQQRPQDAQQMALMFNLELPFAASVVCPTMISNVYAATLRSA
jgi:hypothetical protein